jgi:hypothetical protein
MQHFTAKFGFRLSIVTKTWFVTQTWFVAQSLVSRNVFSTQSFSTKFGSVFKYHAKFFGNNFKKKSFGKTGEKLSA